MPSSKLDWRTTKLDHLHAGRAPKRAEARVERHPSGYEVRAHHQREANLWIPGRFVLVSGMEMERRGTSSES